MMKEDTKAQISLFELPAPERETKVEGRVVKKPKAGKARERVKVEEKPVEPRPKRKEASRAPAGKGEEAKPVSGQVPEGDVRLTANIRQDLHLKLKIEAAHRRTTIGDLIEELVEKFLHV